MTKDIEMSHEEQRHAATALGIAAVQTAYELTEALALLAGRIRNIQQLEGHPRHSETAPSDLTRADEVIRVLHYALTAPDDAILKALHRVAVEKLSHAAADGRNAIGAETGLRTREPQDFGEAVIALLEDLPSGRRSGEIVTLIAGAPIWSGCPFPRLRTLIPGHRLHVPKIETWLADQWGARTSMGPSTGYLARALLVALGVSEADARDSIPDGA